MVADNTRYVGTDIAGDRYVGVDPARDGGGTSGRPDEGDEETHTFTPSLGNEPEGREGGAGGAVTARRDGYFTTVPPRRRGISRQQYDAEVDRAMQEARARIRETGERVRIVPREDNAEARRRAEMMTEILNREWDRMMEEEDNRDSENESRRRPIRTNISEYARNEEEDNRDSERDGYFPIGGGATPVWGMDGDDEDIDRNAIRLGPRPRPSEDSPFASSFKKFTKKPRKKKK